MTEVCLTAFPIHPDDFSGYFLRSSSNSFSSNSSLKDSSISLRDKKPLALVVDDIADVTEMLSVFLGHAGYEVIAVSSAAAAIAAARERKFEVIISDIAMPGMNGYELAEVLRKLPSYEAVPMIAVTGFSMYDDKQRSLKSGFNAYLTKPIDPVGLFQLIEQLRG